MVDVESPLAKKPRIEESSNEPTISLNSSSETNENDVIIVLDDDVNVSAPVTPKTPRTPGSKRKHDADREERKRQREALEEKKREEKEKREQERARQKQARLDEKLKKEDEKRQKQLEREQEAEQRRLKKEREEEAARKAKEEERLRRKAEKEEELRKEREEKQRIADEKKRAKEEERRKAEEEKRKAAEEAERKRPKLDKWLVKQEKPERQIIQAPSNHWLFSAFEIKENMSVAPIHRRDKLTAAEKENLKKTKADKSDYLQHLPKRPLTKTNRLKAKLFQFHTNYRPPYYGTWRKRSKIITGRRPFAKETIYDYEYDSDEEWEEEEEGDECKSDEEDIEEEENDEEDDGFFVEHGYLSSDEGDSDECQHLPGETDEERQRRMKERAEEWKNEQKTKYKRNHTTKLVPNEYGPCFSKPGENLPDIIKNNLHTGIILTFID
jgi:chromatin assembly factor 1 subunit A|uniref:Chromatin assembly factor 1 subunit A n=1 Tax=Panagrolaimus sp. PS1159 TaxID=55785 RepID=A0AC35FUD8_9BILA